MAAVTWHDVLGRTPGLPLAAVRERIEDMARSWAMAGASSEALDPGEGRSDALAGLAEMTAFLDRHIPAVLPEYLFPHGQQVRVQVATAVGPVTLQGTLDQHADLGVQGGQYPAWLVTTAQGIPVWVWQDRIVSLDQEE